MTRRRNRFGTILVVAIAVGLLATVAGAGAVAAQSTVEEKSVTEEVTETVEDESINEIEQESTEVVEQGAMDDPQIELPEDMPIESPDEPVEPPAEPVESPETPEEPVEAPDDLFADVPEWVVDGLF